MIEHYLRCLFPEDRQALPVARVAGNHTVPELRGVAFFDEDALRTTVIADERLAAGNPPIMRRAAFVACLYFEVLFDQALHEYSPVQHRIFSETHAVPKFGHVGMGAHFRHPNEFLRTCFPGFVGARSHLEIVLPAAALAFVRWADALAPGVTSRECLATALERDWGDVGFGAMRELSTVIARRG